MCYYTHSIPYYVEYAYSSTPFRKCYCSMYLHVTIKQIKNEVYSFTMRRNCKISHFYVNNMQVAYYVRLAGT